MPLSAPKFSVIMPAYNEAGGLRENVLETAKVMESWAETYEIILVDDGSTDKTAQIAHALAAELKKFKPMILPINQGKGYALRAGFQAAQGEMIFFLDADLDLHPKQFRGMHQILQASEADLVIGSKRHPLTISNYPWKRRIVSAVYFVLVKWLFGLPIKDTQTGIKLFKREVLAKIFPKILVKKYAFDLELLALANHYGYRIAESPVMVNYRTKLGHIGIKTIFNMWWDTMAVWYRLHVKHYYDRI
jgi:glycosyltransferase involved in cell wall biosynthesis